VAIEGGMNDAHENPFAFAVDDTDLPIALFHTHIDVVRDQLFHIFGPERVQVENVSHLNGPGGIVSHQKELAALASAGSNGSMEAKAIPPDDARRAHRALQGVWMIVSARHEDALARDVAATGEKLRAAIDANDWGTAAEAVEEIRGWMTTMAGVVTSRMQSCFESPPASAR
jgi:hypothetical protein